MTERRSAATLEFVRVTVSENSTDISGDAVELAFVAPWTTPQESDWFDADWEAGGPPWVATLIVGNAATPDLDAGTYIVWVRVTDNPEIPVRPVFQLEVY